MINLAYLLKRVVPSLLIGSLLVIVSACTSQRSIVIYVTPTPGASPTPALTDTPTPFVGITQITSTATPTLTQSTGTAFGPVIAPNSTLPTAAPNTPSPAPTIPAGNFGPVVPPNYTPPPSETPKPITQISPNITVTLPPVNTAGPSSTPGPILRSALMGIQVQGFVTDDQWNKSLAQAKALGVGWIKVQVEWKELETSKGNFNQEYQSLVLHVQGAHLQGFKTMLSVDKAPGWTHPSTASGLTDHNGPPDDPQDLANFVSHLIADCKPEFVDAVEIWNEPNISSEWEGKTLDGGLYMKYFNAAHTAILNQEKAQPGPDPNHRIIVITAGAAPTSTALPNSLDDRTWLRQLYANGLVQTGDDVGVGIHPYGWANAPDAVCCSAGTGITGWYEHPSFYFHNNIDDYRAIMVQNGHGNAKLWPTEFGWAAYDGLRHSNGSPVVAPPDRGWESILNQNQQANYDLQAFYLAQKPPYYDFLGPMMLWNLNYSTIPGMVDANDEQTGFSVLYPDGNPRPAFTLLQNAPKQ